MPDESLNLTVMSHEVGFSDDAGRYLCNQLFFTALDFLRLQSIACSAGFIHLPLANDYPTTRAADAIGHLIQEMIG
jgi:pyrrolidone-carboxylate peptidase